MDIVITEFSKGFLYRSESSGGLITGVEVVVAVVSLAVSDWYSMIVQYLGPPLNVGLDGHGRKRPCNQKRREKEYQGSVYVGVYELLRKGRGDEQYDQNRKIPSQEVVDNNSFMLSDILDDETARETI